MTEEPKPHISPSQLGMIERCPESWRRRYLEGEKIPPGIAMARGSGVHGGAKVNFRQKKRSHEDLSDSDIVDASVAAFDTEVKYGVMLTADEEKVGLRKVVDSARDSVTGLAGIFAVQVAPLYQPVYVEEKQRLVTDLSHDLVCIMDLADDHRRVIDLKTSSKAKTQKDVDKSEQLSFYALVYRALTGGMPSKVMLEVLIDTGKAQRRQTDEETGLPLMAERTDADLRALVARIQTMLEVLKAGIFMPCPGDSWKCDPKWCGYHRTCKYVNPNRR